MKEVQLKVTISSTIKDEATQKAKAEHKTMKQLIEELLIDYVRGNIDKVPTTTTTHTPTPKEALNVSPEDFDSYLDYVDHLERNGLLY